MFWRCYYRSSLGHLQINVLVEDFTGGNIVLFELFTSCALIHPDSQAGRLLEPDGSVVL